jgi:EmrB/QacA subfamily drug resistance transporter
MQTSHEHRSRTYTVAGIALALFLGALDQTIVSTALPRIVADLGGLERYAWVATVYLVVSTLLVPLIGKLSDIVSRKTLELWSVGVFLLGSVLCGMAGEWGTLPFLGDGMTQLVVFRGVQGLGGAGLFALSFIVISDLYPPRERGKVGGVFGAVFGLSSVLGPLVGGFLTDNAGAWIPGIEGWRWVFYVNLPLGAVALWFIATYMPKLQPADKSHKLDVVSVLLLMGSFFPLVLALQLDKTQHPWTSLEILALLIGGAGLFAVWIIHSLRAEHPILDLGLFRDRVFATGVIASFFFGAAFLSILIFLPLYMVNVQGVSATGAGASVIPLTLGVVLGAGVGGWLSSRLGRYKAILLTGAAVVAGGTLMITAFAEGTPLWLILTAMVVTGIGFGPAQSLYALAIQNAVDPRELGQATSFSQFARQIGSTAGAAVAGALFSAAIAGLVPAGTHYTLSQGKMHQGLDGVRAEIAKSFDATMARAEALLELRGDEAKAELSRFLNDDTVPSQVRDRFKDGTPAMQIEQAMNGLYARIEAIVRSGDKTALAALLASPEAKPLPDESREGIAAVVAQSPEARLASLPELKKHMEEGTDHAIELTTLVVQAKLRSELVKAEAQAADSAVAELSSMFSRALIPVWWFNVVLGTLLVAATAFIPGLPLKGRERAPAEA